MAKLKLKSIRIRMYNVGFGDSFLVSFEYRDGSARHMLIDLGTKRKADGGPSPLAVAKLIEQHCGGKLHVLVLSHRHQDHLSGFGQDSVKTIITGLSPNLVVMPWTEHPGLKAMDRAPAAVAAGAPGKLSPSMGAGIGPRSMRLLASVRQEERLIQQLARRAGADGHGLVAELAADAAGESKNPKAVANLAEWAKNGKAAYVYAGQPSGITEEILDIEVTVLGPPTPDQYGDIVHQDDNRPGYWLGLQNALASGASPGALMDPGAEVSPPANVDPGPRRWIVDKLLSEHSASVVDLVTRYDDQMNNTSVVLLIVASGRRLLFPGDAQGESWDYWLAQAGNIQELEKLDFYKVGHHGSRNATSKALYDAWCLPANQGRKITACMSTMPGVFPSHNPKPNSEVPRRTLCEKLQDRMGPLFYRTDVPGGQDFIEVVCDLTKEGSVFRRVP